MPVVEIRRVSFAHAGAPVLREVSVTVEHGEVLALVGASGSGKTTLLKMVNRLLEPDGGEVLVEGRDARSWDPIRLRRRIGYVIQDVGLFPHLTVAANIALVPRLEGWTPQRRDARVAELLDLVGLPAADFADRFPHELSGGQRQRVGVARALAVDPPILLMDEPFGALDPGTRRQLQAEFLRIQERLHKAVLLVTHDMNEAMGLGDRVAVMEGGRVIWCGPPSELLRSDDPRLRQLLDTTLPLRVSRKAGGS
jgi:osmoprotectant transport system ATP-binding protein